ncbi:MAG: hypothetical protein H0V80_08095, partial [Acidobacteria bacterium]|nr:hypothetical protein [Acidobacteriota bacterium]
GMLGALLLIWRDWVASPVGPRTFVAAPAGSPSFGTLAAAVGSARAGDLISLEPGTYPEQLILPDGVSLKARVAGASVFVRPAGAPDGWVAITAAGDGGGTIAGVRVASTPEAAIDVGVRLSGHGRLLELIQIDGPVRTGIDLAADGSMAVQGSHFSLAGPAIVVAAGSQLEVAGSIFVAGTAHRPSATGGPDDGTYPHAITVGDGARVMLRHNVFSGFGPDPFAGLPAADREQMRAGNVVVTAGPSAVR